MRICQSGLLWRLMAFHATDHGTIFNSLIGCRLMMLPFKKYREAVSTET